MRVLAATFAYNEGDKIRRTLARHPPARTYDLLVADDGSTDGALEGIDPGILVLRHETNRGIGATMKEVFQYALDREYDVLVIHAGNDKDEPKEIPLLLDPIVRGEADFVQGSRYLGGGGFGNMPRYRVFSTRVLHPLAFSLAARKRVTESTNGFRAFRTALLRDPRIDWRQTWLDRYELEPYLLLKAIRLGYRHCEVPVTKIYPPHEHGYTKMRPIIDWWSILRPVVLSGPGIEKMIATMHVPFVDLKAQHRALAPEIEAAVRGVFERGDFILGPPSNSSKPNTPRSSARATRFRSAAVSPPSSWRCARSASARATRSSPRRTRSSPRCWRSPPSARRRCWSTWTATPTPSTRRRSRRRSGRAPGRSCRSICTASRSISTA